MRWIVASLLVVNVLAFLYFQLVDEPVSDSSQISVETNLPSGVQPLYLLSENPDKEVAASETKAATPSASISDKAVVRNAPPATQKSAEPVCTIVGAFEKLLKAEYFAERLVALGVNAEIKELSVSSKPGYWLHLRPEPSRKEALRRLSELQRRGIDSYVIPSGDLANGISLGMFSNRDSALGLQKKIKSQGYDPQIVDIAREQKEIWVWLPQGEASKLSVERWAELMTSEQYLQKRQNFCADIASS